MILTIFGTTGELIKLMPVLTRMRERDHAVLLASTGQQVTQIPRLLDLAGLQPVDVWLGRGAGNRDLRSNRDIPGWGTTVARRFARQRRELRTRVLSGRGRPLVLVHGDTMTTLLGALMGRLMRVPVAHIESGLRSFDLRHPFPEELNRRLTSRLADLLYAPGPWAASNLQHGTIVDTGSNTVRDALNMVSTIAEPSITVPDEPFGIVSLHRFELLNDRRLLTETLAALRASGDESRFSCVQHPVTVSAIERFGLTELVSANLTPIPRLDFFEFLTVMRRSAFLVTDSGGSQEESFYLDIPCLIHRRRTERREGLGQNAVLSDLNLDQLRNFLLDPAVHRRIEALPEVSPSRVIVEDLEARGFLVR